MRGVFQDQGGLFSYISLEERVPADHSLRKIRELVRAVLIDMNRAFSGLYADEGRPSIPPEQLLSALLLQVFYGVRQCSRSSSNYQLTQSIISMYGPENTRLGEDPAYQ